MVSFKDSEYKEKKIGFFIFLCNLVITGLYVFACMFMLGDIYIFHEWYYILGSISFTFLILPSAFFLKKKVSLKSSSLICLIAIIFMFMSYIFRTERIIVLDTFDNVFSPFLKDEDAPLFLNSSNIFARRIILFIGEPIEEKKLNDDAKSIASDDIIKKIEEKIQNEIDNTYIFKFLEIEFNDVQILSKEDSDEIIKVVKNLKLSDKFISGFFKLENLNAAYDKNDGMTSDEFKEKFKLAQYIQ